MTGAHLDDQKCERKSQLDFLHRGRRNFSAHVMPEDEESSMDEQRQALALVSVDECERSKEREGERERERGN